MVSEAIHINLNRVYYDEGYRQNVVPMMIAICDDNNNDDEYVVYRVLSEERGGYYARLGEIRLRQARLWPITTIYKEHAFGVTLVDAHSISQICNCGYPCYSTADIGEIMRQRIQHLGDPSKRVEDWT